MPIVSEHEMERRKAMAKAKEYMTHAQYEVTKNIVELTALEWLCVLGEMSSRMLIIGMKEEFENPE